LQVRHPCTTVADSTRAILIRKSLGSVLARNHKFLWERKFKIEFNWRREFKLP